METLGKSVPHELLVPLFSKLVLEYFKISATFYINLTGVRLFRGSEIKCPKLKNAVAFFVEERPITCYSLTN